MMVGAPLWTEILPGHQSRLFRLPWSKWQLGWNDAGIHCMLQSFGQIMRCLTTVLVCSFALLRCLKSWLLQAISLRTTSTSSSIGNMDAQSQAGVGGGSHGQSHKDMVPWSPGDEKKPVVNLGLEDALEGTWIMLGHCGCQSRTFGCESWKRHLDTVTLPSKVQEARAFCSFYGKRLPHSPFAKSLWVKVTHVQNCQLKYNLLAVFNHDDS